MRFTLITSTFCAAMTQILNVEAALALTCAATASAAPAAAPNVLVSGGSPTIINRYDAHTGAFLGQFSPGTVLGPSAMLAMSDGRLLVCGSSFGLIFQFDLRTGEALGFLPSQFVTINAQDMVLHPDGTLLLTSSFQHCIKRMDANSGAILPDFVPPGILSFPASMTFGPDGNLYVADTGDDSVQRFTPQGQFIDVFISAGSGSLDGPFHMKFFGSHLIISSLANDRILKYDAATGLPLGNLVTPGSGGLDGPLDFVIIDGVLLVCSTQNDSVLKFDAQTGTPLGALLVDGFPDLPDTTVIFQLPEDSVPECPSDLTGDSLTDGVDLGVLLSGWGPCGKKDADCPSDLTGDGLTDGVDLGVLLSGWGPCGTKDG